MKRWLQGSLVAGVTATALCGGATVAMAAGYPSQIEVTITQATGGDSSLQPVPPGSITPQGLNFYFFDHAPSFTPTGNYGQGTFSYAGPNGVVTSFPQATAITSAGMNKGGGYVFNVGVPSQYVSKPPSHLWVFSNYQWENSSGEPQNNYSTLENLVQQLPEVPLAAALPAAIGAVLVIRRRKNRLKVMVAD